MRISINPAQTSHGRRGPEGDRPSGSHEQHFLTEDHPAASIPTTHYRSRNFPPRHCLLPSKRSGGRPALRLPRATFSHRRSPCRLHTDHTQQKSEISTPVPSSSICGEVRRATGPPAPTTIIFSPKFCISPLLRSRTTRKSDFPDSNSFDYRQQNQNCFKRDRS